MPSRKLLKIRCCMERPSAAQPLEEVFADPQGVGHDSQGRVHRATGYKETAIYDVEVVQVVCLAIHVERAGLRISPEPDGADLVGHARQRDALTDEQVPRE